MTKKLPYWVIETPSRYGTSTYIDSSRVDEFIRFYTAGVGAGEVVDEDGSSRDMTIEEMIENFEDDQEKKDFFLKSEVRIAGHLIGVYESDSGDLVVLEVSTDVYMEVVG